MRANGFTIKYGAFTINCRPVDENKRVEPSKILEYREQHHFQTPFCLCPLLRTLNEGPVEAAILEKRSGAHIGEYVAECASHYCGYFGEFCHIPRVDSVDENKTVSLDRAYGAFGIPVKKYPSKGELFCGRPKRRPAEI